MRAALKRHARRKKTFTSEQKRVGQSSGGAIGSKQSLFNVALQAEIALLNRNAKEIHEPVVVWFMA